MLTEKAYAAPDADVLAYNAGILNGDIPAGRSINASARRFAADLAREDIYMDWETMAALRSHYRRLHLLGDYSGTPFELAPWQAWVLANIWCWRYTDGNLRRVVNAVLQVARGNGKTTLMAGLALWDLQSGSGRRVYCIANKVEQANIVLDSARAMLAGGPHDCALRFKTIERPEADSEFHALPSKASSLDGLTPSLFIADEAAEYRDNVLAKLETAMAKRREGLGVVISTPSDNADGRYAELITRCDGILDGSIVDDATIPMLFGIDQQDDLEDENCWIKANPGLAHEQPDIRSLRRAWSTRKNTPIRRAEFARYHCCRTSVEAFGWLDMACYPQNSAIDWKSLRGRPAWAGLDLSRSLDMTALVVAVPLDDGTVALRGQYWLPAHEVIQRESDYRLPIRSWAAAGKVTLVPGREVSYELVAAALFDLGNEFQLVRVGYDRWGAKMFAEICQQQSIPLDSYSMGVSVFGPGCQLWQNYWVGGRLRIDDDPVMRVACATAIAHRDRNANITIDKVKRKQIVDPLVAGVIALHCWGGTTRSGYEDLI